MGITAALVFGNFGAAYGTAKSGVGVCSAVVLKPELLFKSIIPIVMAGILGIYGLIVAVLFNGDRKYKQGYPAAKKTRLYLSESNQTLFSQEDLLRLDGSW